MKALRLQAFLARAGVASGEALWGPLGSGYAGEPTLLGPPVNLAERLSKLAAPGEVLTEATTLRLAPGAEGALLGSREVKGMGQVPVYRLVRLALDLPPHRRPLLQTLEARLLTERRLVVHGPAGSGKSFLLEVFRERRARGLPFPTVRLQRMGPEMPLRATLYRAVTEAFGAPEALLRNLPGDLAEALAYSLGLAPRPPWEKRALDEAILAAWREALMGLKTPLLLLLQDLHYPDRTLERFLERMPENLLVLAESRRPLFPARLGLEGLEAPPRLKGVSFQVRSGEIVGIAGVEGNGQTELVEALTGLRPFRGKALLLGRPLPASARGVRDLGASHVPEDRLVRGLVLDFSVKENAVLGDQHRPPFRGFLGFLDDRAAEAHARTLVEAYDVRPRSTALSARRFSGGNQQKIVVGRELLRGPRLLVAAQPTRGVDVGAIEFIHKELVKARDQGLAVLLVSADLSEILALSDRILVMHGGRIVGELTPEEATEERLGLLMAGVTA